MKSYAFALLLVFCSGVPEQLAAQESPPRNCHGVLTASLASDVMHPHFARCIRSLAPELASAIRGARTRSDSSFLGTLLQYGYLLRDPLVFDAAMELATDGGAVPAARVAGLVLAVNQYEPRIEFREPGLGALLSEPMDQNCSEVTFSHLEPPMLATSDMLRAVDNGAPGDAEARVRSLATELRHDPSEPLLLRRLAQCVELLLPESVAPTVSPAAIAISYDCTEDELVVENYTGGEVEVTWRVDGTEEGGYLLLPPRGTRRFWTDISGPVVLEAGSEVVAEMTEERRPCHG